VVWSLLLTNEEKRFETSSNLALNFCQRNYEHIMKAIDKSVPKKSQAATSDLVLECDFAIVDNESFPALQNPPILKVGLLQEYCRADQRSEPNWFGKEPDEYEGNIQRFLAVLEDQHGRLDHRRQLLMILRHPGKERVSVFRVSFQDAKRTQDLFGSNGLEWYRNYLKTYDLDDAVTLTAAKVPMGISTGWTFLFHWQKNN
jgi:hypothetical protein